MAKEYIEKKTILKFIEDGLNNPDKSKAFGHDAIEIMTEVQYAPAADVVEVVRCKDCKHRGTDECIFHIKGEPADEELLKKLDNDFCSYGERRDSNAAD